MAKLPSDRIMLKNVILSYPKLFEPVELMGGKIGYSAQIVIPKTHPQVKELQGKIVAIVKAGFPKIPMKNLKIGLRDNDKETTTQGEVKSAIDPRLAGTLFFNCNADKKYPPQVVSRSKRLLVDDSECYAGCLVNVSVSIYGYEARNEKGIVVSQGVGFGLGNIQVVELRERWDGRRSAFDEFEALDEPETGADAEGEVEADAVAATQDEDDKLPWD